MTSHMASEPSARFGSKQRPRPMFHLDSNIDIDNKY